MVEDIQMKSKSRSNCSTLPIVEEDQESASSSTESTNQNTANHSRVTRSPSVESSSETIESRKRKRKSTSSNINNSKEEVERETRTSKNTKEARDAKKAKKDMIIKERLEELDKLEETVKDGTHGDYHILLQTIEDKKTSMTKVAEMRRSLAESNVIHFFQAQKYAADSQYNWDKLALRRSMIEHIQHKINLLEQEYYSNHIQNENHLNEWVPPDRPTMISSLTMGLSEEDAENDIEWAKAETVHKETYPLDMLPSLDDEEKNFPLPPLNPWR